MRRSIVIVTVTDVDMYCYECGNKDEYRDMDSLVANVLKVTH